MVYRDERHVERIRQPLCKRQPDEQRAQKPRAVSDGDRVDIRKCDARFGDGARSYLFNSLGMRARSNFRHDAAVLCLLGGGRDDTI